MMPSFKNRCLLVPRRRQGLERGCDRVLRDGTGPTQPRVRQETRARDGGGTGLTRSERVEPGRASS